MSAVDSDRRIAALMHRKLGRIRDGARPRVLDLFSGCGGLSLGFLRAGFEIWKRVETDPFAAASHAVNFHGSPQPRSIVEMRRHTADILETEPAWLAESSQGNEPAETVDVLVGGPPCQAYARVGRAKLRQVMDHPEAFRVDPRGNLYLRYLEYVEVLKPLVIVMENVPDALNYGGHNVAEETVEVLEDLGYRCVYTLLNAVNYGVPQTRERMILLACHSSLDIPIAFPEPTHHCDLPPGYKGVRSTALRPLLENGASHYVEPPEADPETCAEAVTVERALSDLPPIMGHLTGRIRRGPRNMRESVRYATGAREPYAMEMRNWPSFETDTLVTGHVIRSLPRDYKIFRRMRPGDQYPEAHTLAERLFESFVERCRGTRREVPEGSDAWHELRANFVPPYDPGKFPNKWRKMEPDQPARTVMAHLGKDSYSHIHHDSRQARTISVREAARLQSFPDGFIFAGAMNAAFRQIGNAVPPLLAWRIADTIMGSISM